MLAVVEGRNLKSGASSVSSIEINQKAQYGGILSAINFCASRNETARNHPLMSI